MIFSRASNLPTLTFWMGRPIAVKVLSLSLFLWTKEETHLQNEFKNAGLDMSHT